MKIKNEIKNLISDDKVPHAIKILKNIVRDTSHYNQIILLANRYIKTKTEQSKGIIENSIASLEFNKVSNSLIELIDDLPGELDLFINNLESSLNESQYTLPVIDLLERILINPVEIGQIKKTFNEH